MTPPTIPAVLDRHAEEAAILWLQRDRAVVAPHYTLRSLAELDDRLEAHLDGLRVAGKAGSERAWQEFEEHPEPGETFTAAVLAFEAADTERIGKLLSAAADQVDLVRPLISAAGWLSAYDVAVTVPLLLTWGDPLALRVGIGGAAVRREHPGGNVLARAIRQADAGLRGRVFRAIGEFGDKSLVHELYSGQTDTDPDCRFWATWSTALLTSDPAALTALRHEVRGSSTRWAIDLAARRGDPKLLRGWIRGRFEEPDLRLAIQAAGAFGEADNVPWLIDRTTDPAVARLAGEAITTITGLDLANSPAGGAAPRPQHTSGPTDAPEDDDVTPDPDSDLPWPDANFLRRWWQSQRNAFPTQRRLLLGRPITTDWLRRVLTEGGQRHRIAAAFELSTHEPGRPLRETRAAGWLQLGSGEN